MTTSRKTSRARTATSREEDTMMLQCIQALFDMQGTGLKAPESLNDCADKSKLAKAVAQYQAENGGSILAAMGAVWFKKAAEMLMESELAAHLGYNKYERLPNQSNDTPEIASDAPSDVPKGNGRRKVRATIETARIREKCTPPVEPLKLIVPGTAKERSLPLSSPRA